MPDLKANNKLSSILTFIPAALIVLAIGSIIFISFHNRSTADAVISEYKPMVSAMRTVVRTNCNEIPEEFGSRESLDIDRCKEIMASGEGGNVINDMIDAAKGEYSKKLEEKGPYFTVGEFILNIAFGPVRYDRIDSALR